MKKLLGALLIGVMVLAVTAQAAPAGKIGLGIDTAAANIVTLNMTSLVLRYNLTEQIVGRLGLNYNSYKTQANVTTTQTGYSLRVDYMLPASFGAAKPLVGLSYSSDGATAATSILSLLLGIEAEVADGVVLGAGLIPYSTATTSGAANPDTLISTGSSNGILLRGSYISASFYLN